MKIQINKPCQENWDAMKIGMISRHCDECEKPVYDFTSKSKAEILTYLLENHTKSICGRVAKSQLDFHRDELEVIIEGLKTKKGNNTFAILSMACLLLVACGEEEEVQQQSKMTNQIKQTQEPYEQNLTELSIETDSTMEKGIEHNDILNGDPAFWELNPDLLITLGDICILPEKEPKINSLDGINDSIDLDYARIFVEKMPEYKGGIDSLFAYLGRNIVYPAWEKKKNIQGKVYASFIVEKDGSISNAKILRGVEKSKNFNKEVLRVVKIMPKWIPGENKGEKVAVRYNLPVKFTLSN